MHLRRDIIHECFHPASTSITPLSQVFSLSSSSATCLHSASFYCVPSPQAPSKSNPEPCADGLWYSSHRFSTAAKGCSVWRSAPHSCFCQQFNSEVKLTKWILFNCLFGAVIISNATRIPNVYIDSSDMCFIYIFIYVYINTYTHMNIYLFICICVYIEILPTRELELQIDITKLTK